MIVTVVIMIEIGIEIIDIIIHNIMIHIIHIIIVVVEAKL